MVLMLKDLRIADLELFITAAQLSHLGQAAEKHFLSQSAASSSIKRIEGVFGLPLCEHQRKGFKLTKEGKFYLPQLQEWLRQLYALVDKTTMPLRVVTTHAIARAYMPRLLAMGTIDLKLMRPDLAYAAVLREEADLALVLNNAPWEAVEAQEVDEGFFRLYSREKEAEKKAILLPEDQLEVLSLQQKWQRLYGSPLPIRARIPSWSLIADLCLSSAEVGFLPDFLVKGLPLFPVSWQPSPAPYTVLALYTSDKVGNFTQDLLRNTIYQK